jgi:hypothetical protein
VTTATVFQAIEAVLAKDPHITFKALRIQAKASNGAILAYLKRRQAA